MSAHVRPSGTATRITGGQAGVRGYLLQAIAAVLDGLAEQSSWTTVTVEPTDADAKVDIRWSYPHGVKVTQVKSSANPIAKKDIEAWANELQRGTPDAIEYELRLFGPCRADVGACTIGNVTVPTPDSLNIDSLLSAIAQRLDEVCEDLQISPAVRRLFASSLTATVAINSISGRSLTREQLLSEIRKWTRDIRKSVRSKMSAGLILALSLALLAVSGFAISGRTRIVRPVAVPQPNDDELTADDRAFLDLFKKDVAPLVFHLTEAENHKSHVPVALEQARRVGRSVSQFPAGSLNWSMKVIRQDALALSKAILGQLEYLTDEGKGDASRSRIVTLAKEAINHAKQARFDLRSISNSWSQKTATEEWLSFSTSTSLSLLIVLDDDAKLVDQREAALQSEFQEYPRFWHQYRPTEFVITRKALAQIATKRNNEKPVPQDTPPRDSTSEQGILK